MIGIDFKREIRDPIHGFITVSSEEDKIINTTIFQRLRRVKQLAMANLVYPGALHSRFEHSLGTMHIAGKLAERLNFNQESRDIVRLAALLHDIGHGPFSHVSEYVLDKYYDRTKINTKTTEKIHEFLTCDIIKKNNEIKRILGEDRCEEISNLLMGISGKNIETGVISGPLDADKQDYLLRDSYFCGVKYGVFDSHRLISTLCKREDDLAVSSDGLYAIEQFILAKYHMNTQVYRHKIRLITDCMIIRSLELGIEVDNLKWLKDIYCYDATEKHLNEYTSWDDFRLTTALLYPLETRGKATEIFHYLNNRQLFKIIFSMKICDSIITDVAVRNFLMKSSKEKDFSITVEKAIAEYLNASKRAEDKIIPQEYVIINSFNIKSVRAQSTNDEGYILVDKKDNSQPQFFENESTLFRSINNSESDQNIEVYAPLNCKESDRKKRYEQFGIDIKNIIIETAKKYLSKK